MERWRRQVISPGVSATQQLSNWKPAASLELVITLQPWAWQQGALECFPFVTVTWGNSTACPTFPQGSWGVCTWASGMCVHQEGAEQGKDLSTFLGLGFLSWHNGPSWWPEQGSEDLGPLWPEALYRLETLQCVLSGRPFGLQCRGQGRGKARVRPQLPDPSLFAQHRAPFQG